MIDSATCNATNLAACPTSAPPTVDVGASPDDVDVDQATHTVYVTTIGALNGLVGVRREHLQRDRTIGMRDDRLRSTGDPDRPQRRPRSTRRTTPCTRPTGTTRVSAFDLRTLQRGRPGGLRHRRRPGP